MRKSCKFLQHLQIFQLWSVHGACFTFFRVQGQVQVPVQLTETDANDGVQRSTADFSSSDGDFSSSFLGEFDRE